MDHIADLLRRLDMKFQREDKIIEMRWKTSDFDDLRIRLFPNENESWLYIVSLFQSFTDIPEDKRLKFATDLLKSSWQANGVKFALEERGRIVIVSETNDTDITEDELRILVGHVVYACGILNKLFDELRES